MAANGISTLEFKHDRQSAKLAAAAAKRSTTGRRSTLDVELLPTQYAEGEPGNKGVLIDNDNTGGLVEGRPWTD